MNNDLNALPPYLRILVSLSLIDLESIVAIWPRCRDRENMPVWRCPRSGVIFVRESTRTYSTGDHASYYSASTRTAALQQCAEDDTRRLTQFRELARNATWLDVGTGLGGFLELARNLAEEVVGVEPQDGLRLSATNAGLTVIPGIEGALSGHFDVVSLFHVFEHLSDPLAMLAEAKRCLKPGATLLIEVPHARDAMLSLYDLDAFKEHTFWSEHLTLHTRESLRGVLTAAGFKVKAVLGVQRYPLANHLHWLSRHARGGHKHWSFISADALDAAYAAKLAEIDATDTILAIATN